MSLNWQGKPRSIQLGSSDLMLKFYMKLVKGHSWHLSETNSPFCNMIARLKLHFHWNISRGISRFSLHDYSLPSNVYLANINRSVQRSGFIAQHDRNSQDYWWYTSTNHGHFFILRQNTRNAKNVRQISNENWKTVKYRIETISNRTPFFGQIFPMIIKLATSLHDFRLNIKN